MTQTGHQAWKLSRFFASVVLPDLRLVVQDHVQKRVTDFQFSVVFNIINAGSTLSRANSGAENVALRQKRGRVKGHAEHALTFRSRSLQLIEPDPGDEMFRQLLTPVGDSLGLSFLIAILPVVAVLVLLGLLRRPAWQAALAGRSSP